jgi:hypothetical protein
MKTTINLPEDLLHRAKIAAAQRKTTLRELVVQGLEFATREPDPETTRKKRNHELLDALSAIQITEPVGKFNRDEIHDRQENRWE